MAQCFVVLFYKLDERGTRFLRRKIDSDLERVLWSEGTLNYIFQLSVFKFEVHFVVS